MAKLNLTYRTWRKQLKHFCWSPTTIFSIARFSDEVYSLAAPLWGMKRTIIASPLDALNCAQCLMYNSMEVTENLNINGKARMICKRDTWIFRLLHQTRIQKGTKFIGRCIIPSLIFPASSFQLIDFHCWLSHVHGQLGGHFISLLLIFSCRLRTPPHGPVTSTNLNCLLSTRWYSLCTMCHAVHNA